MSQSEISPADADPPRFAAALSDGLIVPLAALAVALRRLLRALLRLLVRLLDYAFPILLQVMRFPLFTLRLIGDGLAALSRAVVGVLPIGGGRRDQWQAAIAARWAWLRQRISYRAFEEAVHHAFENGMAWVFRTCKGLSSGQALLLLIAAALWIPISFTLATVLHGVLLAKAVSWPAWTQLLHPLATVIAKTKLLVLPVFPAAWPQAKSHTIVETLATLWRAFVRLPPVRRFGERYRQIDAAVAQLRAMLAGAARQAGLSGLWDFTVARFNAMAARAALWRRAIGVRIGSVLSKTPLIGMVLAHYARHYERAGARPAEPLSERVSDFFARWSVKFTAEYYEAKERAEAAKRDAMA